MSLTYQPPIILLAFANDLYDARTHLRNLTSERKQIHKLFDGSDLGVPLPLPDVTRGEIFDAFQDVRYARHIAIFHYGGHADDDRLQLEDQEGL